jgi:competence protein ComGC
MSVASTKFASAAFALVEVLIVVAAIALHLAIICIVLALPIGRITTAPLARTLKLAKTTRPQIERDLTALAARTH